jgi:hypothetical protein
MYTAYFNLNIPSSFRRRFEFYWLRCYESVSSSISRMQQYVMQITPRTSVVSIIVIMCIYISVSSSHLVDILLLFRPSFLTTRMVNKTFIQYHETEVLETLKMTSLKIEISMRVSLISRSHR